MLLLADGSRINLATLKTMQTLLPNCVRCQPMTVHGVTLDFVDITARSNDRLLDLTFFEYRLLSHLVRRDNFATRQELLESVWNYSVSSANLVEARMHTLRRKLPHGFIEFEHGKGYRVAR